MHQAFQVRRGEDAEHHTRQEYPPDRMMAPCTMKMPRMLRGVEPMVLADRMSSTASPFTTITSVDTMLERRDAHDQQQDQRTGFAVVISMERKNTACLRVQS